jgi:uncharacterized protein YrrD
VTDTTSTLVGGFLYDSGGQKVGKITDVIFNDRTLQPDWYVVKEGMLKGKHLVPVGEVRTSETGAVAPYAKELIHSAPKPEGPSPTDSEQEALCAHYLTVGPRR